MNQIGLVKVDIHRAEHQFKQISFSDVDCIKGLIKNRWIIDPYYEIEKDNNYNKAGNVLPMNQELICVFADLDNLIQKTKLNEKQSYIINRLMQGYTFDEIATDTLTEPRTIERILDTIAQKIKKINDYQWKYDYLYLNYLKVNWDYKECSKCKEFKPKTEEFFGKDERNIDKMKSYCKECDGYTKKTS